MLIELGGLGTNNVQLESCVELGICSHLFGYRKSFGPVDGLEKNFFVEIDLHVPYRIHPDEDKSIMPVRIGKRQRRITGQYGNLLAIFVLARQYQNGTMFCEYCKRIVPDQCQIVGFLRFLEDC